MLDERAPEKMLVGGLARPPGSANAKIDSKNLLVCLRV